MKAYEIATCFVKEQYLEDVAKILDSGMLILGEYTDRLERDFAADHDRKHGIACASDTSALEMVLDSIGVRGEYVLLPDASFFGCVNTILKCGGRPVPVPCRVSNGAMPTTSQWLRAVEEVEDIYGKTPKIALFVYTAGGCGVDTEEAVKAMEKKMIGVVEDAAHCQAARYTNGDMVGKLGFASTFSFYATKVIHSGEGGMVVTNDSNLNDDIRIRRDYGKGLGPDGRVQPIKYGYNWRMTEMQAALAWRLWNARDKVIKAREIVESVYDDSCLKKMRMEPHAYRPGLYKPNVYRYIVLPPNLDDRDRIGWSQFQRAAKSAEVPFQAKCNSKALQDFLLFENDLVFLPCLRESETPDYCHKHVCLPIHPKMSLTDAEQVVEFMIGYCL